MSEVLLALKEAKRVLNNLLDQYPIGHTTRRLELNKNLKQIKDQIIIIEKFLDPCTVAELEEMGDSNG